ncbi:MAG TPA: hypothetical protein VN647_11205 [Nitrospira sp.]|nr:hypothetical protein [Nitrospira sp.]
MNATDQNMRRKVDERRLPAGPRSWVLLCSVSLMLGVGGCSLSYDTTNTPRAATEQLVLAQAFQRSLIDAVVPVVRPGQSVAVETTGLTTDQGYASALIERWLNREGFHVPKDGKETLVVRVTLDTFGTLHNETFFGMPALSSAFIPFALPQLTLYQATRQRGLARFSMDFLDKTTGRLVGSTPTYEGDAYYNKYIFLLVFSTTLSDLIPPVP